MRDTPSSRTDTLKRRFAYDEWAAREGHGALFVWNATLAGTELPGLTRARVKRTEPRAVGQPAERIGAADAPVDEAARVHEQSLWRDQARPDLLVRVDALECLSPADAREKALWLLGEFESPRVERIDGVGDVSFASPGDGLILFVRANLVCLVRNAGRPAMPLRQAAQALDAALVSTGGPPIIDGATLPAARAEGGGAERVEVTVDTGTAADVSRVVAAPAGELALEDGRLVYRGPRWGLERVTIHERPAAAAPSRSATPRDRRDQR